MVATVPAGVTAVVAVAGAATAEDFVARLAAVGVGVAAARLRHVVVEERGHDGVFERKLGRAGCVDAFIEREPTSRCVVWRDRRANAVGAGARARPEWLATKQQQQGDRAGEVVDRDHG